MRKKIALISVTVGFCLCGVLCYKTWIITFVITKYLSGRKDGKQGIFRSIIIPWRDYHLHLHHWLLALIVGGILAVKGLYIMAPEAFYGVVSAVIFQGIYCYGDWYRIIKRNRTPSVCEQRVSLLADNSLGSRTTTTKPDTYTADDYSLQILSSPSS